MDGPNHVGIARGAPISRCRAECDSVSVGNRIGDVGCVRRVLSLFPVRFFGRGQVGHFRVTCMTRDCCNSVLDFCHRRIKRGRCSVRIGGGNASIIIHDGIVFV